MVTPALRLLGTLALACTPALVACATPARPPAAAPTNGTAVESIQAEARRLLPTTRSPFARQFLAATSRLPHVAPRTLFANAARDRFWTAGEAAALADRQSLKPITIDEETYYETKYGTPVSYARPLDVLAEHGVALRAGDRLLDFGYGYVGHLRLFAALGLTATGVDVDPMLRALYSAPGDQGTVQGDGGGRVRGSLRLIDGHFPRDPAVVAAVGAGYALILSKNVLKRGYIHPERPADPRHLIDLGLPDDLVLRAFFDALAPGGAMLVYNICPAPSPPDRPFVPWSDGRSPFSRAAWMAAGFEVVAFDADDTAAVRVMGRALEWDKDPDDPMDLEHDLSVLYTLVKRPA